MLFQVIYEERQQNEPSVTPCGWYRLEAQTYDIECWGSLRYSKIAMQDRQHMNHHANSSISIAQCSHRSYF